MEYWQWHRTYWGCVLFSEPMPDDREPLFGAEPLQNLPRKELILVLRGGDGKMPRDGGLYLSERVHAIWQEPARRLRGFVGGYGRTIFAIAQMSADALICATLSFLVIALRMATDGDYSKYTNVHLYIWTTVAATATLIVSCAHSGVYDPLRLSSSAAPVAVTTRRFFEVILLLTGGLFVLKVSDGFSRFWLLAWGGASLVALAGLRMLALDAAQRLVRGGRLRRNVAIVGADEIGRRLAAELTGRGAGTHLVGLFDEGSSQTAAMPHVGAVETLEELASEGRVDEIIITAATAERMVEFCRRFQPFPVALRVLAPKGFEVFRLLEGCRYGEISTFLVIRKPFSEAATIVKWLEDKLIALLCLFVALPLMLVIALAIKLDSRGPVFFRQQRLGANNRPFNLLKFRSMYADKADPLGSRLTSAGDSRVTRVGRLLRSTSLDELPQLLNVLRGDMSLVGPRPHAVAAQAGGLPYVKAVDGYPLRHRVKPGMTGWAQVNGWRGDTTRIEQLKGRVECDLYYVENWSLGLDLLILGRTVVTVLSRHNAV
jgi:Undecaprenyl-phosphate glucose phosphotransferase